ncbi:MAG: transglutaminase family protein [Elusimicrobiota bacterium]
MKDMSRQELRSLASLLDDDDEVSLDLVRRQILRIGDPILPYLEEMRGGQEPRAAARAEGLARRVRFEGLKRDFKILARKEDPSLEEGMWIISRFTQPDLDPAPYRRWLDRVAGKIDDETPSGADPMASIQKINRLLFHDMGFAGNRSDYYNPDNSYIHRVIETRRGIPLSLSILYLLIAERLGLPLRGVSLPGHFMLGLKIGAGICLLDAFSGGRLLDVSEAHRLLLRNGYELKSEHLNPASSREMFLRTLRNLISIHQKTGAEEDSNMLSSLAEILLAPNKPRHPESPR